MSKQSMKSFEESSYLAGGAAYVETLYETYLTNPQQVEPSWRSYFEKLQGGNGQDKEALHSDIRAAFAALAKQNHRVSIAPVTAAVASAPLDEKQLGVYKLVYAYRSRGHQQAVLDPLGLAERVDVPELMPDFHGLEHNDMDKTFLTGSFTGMEKGTLREIHEVLTKTYCGTVGVEYMHITDHEEVNWIQERIESGRSHAAFTSEKRREIFQKLTEAEGLERYLGSKYVGQKRFSLEGGGSLIPLMHEAIQRSGEISTKEVVIGMAHRGRLNVLINILGKKPADLFAEFEGKTDEGESSGDVKYHLGYSSDIQTPGGVVHLTLSFNPSHLEIISPVVEGSVRARQDRRQDKDKNQVLPILIHGDAAVAGQGVVMETFNLSQARGFATGGSIHVVVNNQIGFTTSNPLDSRSTLYCTDVAKMIQIPIFHVNADDPEAVVWVTQLAVDYRHKFKKDVVIDLVCYRRHGHNEADEPSATQPLMYRTIKSHPTARTLYAEYLVKEGVFMEEDIQRLADDYRNKLDAHKPSVEVVEAPQDEKNPYIINWAPYFGVKWDDPADTTLSLERIKSLSDKLLDLPEGFKLQAQVKRTMDQRKKMAAGEIAMDWGFAETMAYAGLVTEGYPVRLCGQDCGRGTFAHRHSVLHDQNSGEVFVPLRNLAQDQENFLVIDSVLSEEAVLGFEYGYASANPHTLVIWEAQFGDFANGAQVIFDQFLSSGEQKWGRLAGLTVFLPHGYEGAGPEHSSARLERYLQLCAQHNMQVCVPSTPAQAFHMIRRQMIRPYRKPLIVMTPKSLLRHKAAVSTLNELTDGNFQVIIPETEDLAEKKVKTVILCSGKVYYDLLAYRQDTGLNHCAIIRIEQLYPFPEEQLREILASYTKAKDVVWCQEEPMNQGAWYSTRHHFTDSLASHQTLRYAGREASASPAAGYARLDRQQQVALVVEAFGE